MASTYEIARAFETTRQYVQKCIKKGCPTDSVENALLWRELNAKSKSPTSPTSVQKIIEEKEDESPEARERRKKYLENRSSGELPEDYELEDAVIAARQSAGQAWRLLELAMAEGKPSVIAPFLAIHNKALEALFKAEQSYREELERRNILIEVSVANDMARKGWSTVISDLSRFPQNVASRCNPHDPNHAMDILQKECAAIISSARKAFEL
jgi:hypothetical protein